jgi:hypothetical protein
MLKRLDFWDGILKNQLIIQYTCIEATHVL